MSKVRKHLSVFLAVLLTIITMLGNLPAQAASKAVTVPQVMFANAPVTEYTVGDRVNFNIFSPNYGGRVEYRVVLWNDSQKTYYDLWHPGNGYPTRYYTKWQPFGNNIFTLGWIINEPGTYRITVYAKRVGVPNTKTAIKGMNCDSYMESVAFTVKSREEVVSIMPVTDITINQGSIPVLPTTVRAIMNNGTERTLKVAWGAVDTTKLGTFIIEGTVEGTYKKASVRIIVNQGTFSIDNVYSVQAKTNTEVDINLKNSISFIPTSARFAVRDSNNIPVRINTLVMSSDKKVIQISTDFMTPEKWYILTIDGRDYNFLVPYTPGNTATITANDVQVGVGKAVDSVVKVNPKDLDLYFTSQNPTIAQVNASTGEIYGVKAGTTTILVYAKRSGTVVGYTSFDVLVGNSYQTPDEDNSYADYDDNGDGTATIYVEVMDTDDDPIEDLEASDFVFVMNRKTYGIGSRSPFIDFEELGDGVYEITFEPNVDDEDFPFEEEIDILVFDEYVCRDLEIEVTKEEDVTDPEAGELSVKIYRAATKKYETIEVDYDEGYEAIQATKKSSTTYDKLGSVTIEVDDEHLDTENVKVSLTKPDGTKVNTFGYFKYNSTYKVWVLSLSASYSLNIVGTYKLEATFKDLSDNELDIEIPIEVTEVE